MKKLALSAIVTLFAVIGLASCSGNGCATPDVSSKAPEEGLINIRYYNLDSVINNYKLLEKLNAESEEVMANYQNRERSYANEIQNMAAKIEQKVRNNTYLSEQSYNDDMKKFQDRQAQVQQNLAELQAEIQRQAASQQTQILDSINNFLKAYNEVNHFDAILVMQPGTYFDQRLNITDEIVKGLNDRYNEEPAKAAPAKAEAK
ncbi:MAG: OmpH family outer membrane protein [Muribaculaceae bacterium]|nr:OmpH family outer membrane protein [Muribaculaceae bacterium]